MKPSLVIIGLGNHEASYAKTRHNAGFWAVDKLQEEFGESEWSAKQKFLSEVAEARIVTAPVLLVKPQTFMNLTGDAAAKIVDFYKIEPSQLLVLSDDVDLALGEIRFRESGGPGTHNGLKSIVEKVGEDFPRIRIGLGEARPGEDLSNWVLSTPGPDEREKLDAAIAEIPEKVREFVMGD